MLDIFIKIISFGFPIQRIEEIIRTSTSIARGKFNKNAIEFKNIFQAYPPIDSPYHFGSRLAINGDYLFASVGERGQGMIAQDASNILVVLLEFI